MLQCENDNGSSSDSTLTDSLPLCHLLKRPESKETVVQPMETETVTNVLQFSEPNNMTIQKNPVRTTRFTKSYSLEVDLNLEEEYAFESDDDSDRDPNYIDVCSVAGCKRKGSFNCKICAVNTFKMHLNKTCPDHYMEEITMTESDEEPESKKKQVPLKTNKFLITGSSNTITSVTADINSDEAPINAQTCEIRNCENEVFSACTQCLILLCWEHFIADSRCETVLEYF